MQAFACAPRFRSGLVETAPALAAPTPVGVETQTCPGVRGLSDSIGGSRMIRPTRLAASNRPRVRGTRSCALTRGLLLEWVWN